MHLKFMQVNTSKSAAWIRKRGVDIGTDWISREYLDALDTWLAAVDEWQDVKQRGKGCFNLLVACFLVVV